MSRARHSQATASLKALKRTGGPVDTADWPAAGVTWEEANGFAEALCRRERAAGRLPDGYVYRLPTEAEWEYVCRAGSQTPLSCGNDPDQLHLFANYADADCIEAGVNQPMVGTSSWKGADRRDGWAVVAPCKSLRPNAWGFFDMPGNVSEDGVQASGPDPLRRRSSSGGGSHEGSARGWGSDRTGGRLVLRERQYRRMLGRRAAGDTGPPRLPG